MNDLIINTNNMKIFESDEFGKVRVINYNN